MLFDELGVKPEIVRALKESGMDTPMLIQEKTILLTRSGKDLIGISKTGSGKTLAFGIPILETVVHGRGLQALVVAPTRELAVQIARELKKFGKHVRCTISTIYGGVSLGPQIDDLARSDVIVGTPGRLVDHLNRGNLNLTRIRVLVFDEADKMVEQGFIQDIEQILSYTPKNRQVLLFGATISDEIERLKQKYMDHPAIVKTEAHVKEEFLEQYYVDCEPHEKFSLLVHLFKKEQPKRAIIFCSARSTVEIVARNLRQQGINAEMIHGKLSQPTRMATIDRFHQGKSNVLVASAVAARGLDIKGVSHIFNYDLSMDPKEYIHRIGRTARASETGKAITLLCNKDHEAFSGVLRSYPVDVHKIEKGEFPKVRFQARMQTGERDFRDRRGPPRRFGDRRAPMHGRGERTEHVRRFEW